MRFSSFIKLGIGMGLLLTFAVGACASARTNGNSLLERRVRALERKVRELEKRIQELEAEVSEKPARPITMVPLSNWNGPYIAPPVPKDPWGRDFVYRCPGAHGEFDIICYGKDGAEGGEGFDRDITNHNLDEEPPRPRTVLGRWLGKDRARWTVAKAHIVMLQMALEEFYIDTGTYPTTEQGLKALIEQPTVQAEKEPKKESAKEDVGQTIDRLKDRTKIGRMIQARIKIRKLEIEQAAKFFEGMKGRPPKSLEELQEEGFIIEQQKYIRHGNVKYEVISGLTPDGRFSIQGIGTDQKKGTEDDWIYVF